MTKNTDRWDAEVKAATEIMGTLDDDAARQFRRSMGFESPLHSHGHGRWAQFWNWAFDTEYTAIGPPPIAWIVVGTLLLIVLALVFVRTWILFGGTR